MGKYTEHLNGLQADLETMRNSILSETVRHLETDSIDRMPPLSVTFEGYTVNIPLDIAFINGEVDSALAVLISAIKEERR